MSAEREESLLGWRSSGAALDPDVPGSSHVLGFGAPRDHALRVVGSTQRQRCLHGAPDPVLLMRRPGKGQYDG